jgi:hypothetical protein
MKLWKFAPRQVFNLPPKVYSQGTTNSNMKHPFTWLPTRFTVIFLRHMPPLQLNFRREEIINHSPQKKSGPSVELLISTLYTSEKFRMNQVH